MSSKKNGLVENKEVETTEITQPTQETATNEVVAQEETPGHGTRAFRA